jgi:FHA domain
MAKLYVEEGGRRRAFRVREGRLSLGAGEACTLRLESPDVADVHAEIELREGRVTLAPRPGVLPPTLDGKPVRAPAVLRDGARFTIGGAGFQLEYEEGEAGAAAPGAAPLPARGAPPRGPAGANAAAAAPPRPRVTPTRPLHEVRRGVPPWLVVLGFAAALLVGGALMGKLWNKGASSFNPVTRYNEAVAYHNVGEHDRAQQVLDNLDRASLPPDLRAKVEELEASIRDAHAERKLDFHNEQGTEYLDTQLKRFEKERLQGDPPPEAVRVFLKRCRTFRETWPQHPDMDWVDRREARFRGYVDLGQPATFKDVEYEIKTLTWAMPRDYKQAFQLLDDFLAHASGEDHARALELQAKLVEERQAYFDDRMQQAAWLWRRDAKGEAVEWLAQLVLKVGDDAMQAAAAKELIGLPGIEGWLRGYKRDRPEKFDGLMEDAQIRAFAREKEIQ